MKDTIKDIWVNHKNELIKFLEEKGQGIYDEALLEASIEDEKKELLDKVCEWLDGVIYDYITLEHANVDTFIYVDNERLIKDLRKDVEE